MRNGRKNRGSERRSEAEWKNRRVEGSEGRGERGWQVEGNGAKQNVRRGEAKGWGRGGEGRGSGSEDVKEVP